MKLPWVSRTLYEHVVAQWQEAQRAIERWQDNYLAERANVLAERAKVLGLEQAVQTVRTLYENDVKAREAECAFLRGMIDRKDATIIDLRREGFDPPAPQPPTTHELRAKLDPAILHRIEQIAQPGEKLHFEMLQEAEALVAAYPDRPAEQIADEVTEGSPISPWRL